MGVGIADSLCVASKIVPSDSSPPIDAGECAEGDDSDSTGVCAISAAAAIEVLASTGAAFLRVRLGAGAEPLRWIRECRVSSSEREKRFSQPGCVQA